MKNFWNKYIEANNGNHLAKDSFEELSKKLCEKHFPNKDIVSTYDIEKFSPKKLTVVFFSRLFTDEFTDSRKGQVRKSFQKFLKYKKEKNIKTYKWVLTLSYTLTNEENIWWYTWSSKMYKEHGISIELIDSQKIIELSKKYELYDEWFNFDKEQNKQITEKQNITSESEKTEEKEKYQDVAIETENGIVYELLPEKKEKLEKEEKIEKTENKLLEETKEEAENSQKVEDIIEEVVEEKKSEENTDKEIEPAKKILFRFKYDFLKNEYKRIKELADKFSKEELKELSDFNSNEDWKTIFNQKEDLETSTIKLFYKAKSYEVRNKYIQAVFVYEHILKLENYKEVLKFKLEETYKSLKKCQDCVFAIIEELEGDVYLLRKNKIKAIEHYQKAMKYDDKEEIYAKKYYETLGDTQIENDLPEEAFKSYEKAIDNSSDKDETLELKYQNAKFLANGKKYFKSSPLSLLNVFISPFAYMNANKIINDEKTTKKLNTSSKKFFYTLAAILLLFVFIYWAFAFNKGASKDKNNIYQVATLTEYEIPASPEHIAIAKGDIIMNNITLEKIHLIDTAIATYNRALEYNPKSEIAYEHLNIAYNFKKEYLSKAQANILLDSASYFVSMRRSSEGLRLFKYLFKADDKSSGKYGYVDENMRIVIPPFYDFNYKKMYSGKENFVDGLALVCLVLSQGDTVYYKINNKNKIIKKL